MKTAIVIPIKRLSEAKSRLAGALTDGERQTLALDMARHVLREAVETDAARVLAVTTDDRVRSVCAELGVLSTADRGADLNGVLSRAFELCWGEELAPLYLPADLPFLRAGEIQGLLDTGTRTSAIAIAPSRDLGGTNGLFLPPHARSPLCLGEDSYRRHLRAFERRALPVTVYYARGLALDVDTEDDLKRLRELAPRAQLVP